MKKAVAFILSLALLLSLCACGKTNNAANTTSQVGSTINFTPKTDFEVPAIEPVTVTDSPRIELDLATPEIPTIEPVTVAESSRIDLDLNFDFEFSVDPVEVKAGAITFEFADYQHDIVVDTFDVNKFAADSSANLSDELKKEIPKMDVQEVVAIAETRANLLADLSHAFKSAGLAITVDEALGEIMLDSSVLFAVDESTISDAGKDFLRKFLAVYTTVVFNPKYEDFISNVLVEGHTDSSGNYDYNLKLSQNRAESVLAFCLSEESGVDTAHIAELEKTLEAIGYSCDKLIYDENGKENSTASRRVSFRFLIASPNS